MEEETTRIDCGSTEPHLAHPQGIGICPGVVDDDPFARLKPTTRCACGAEQCQVCRKTHASLGLRPLENQRLLGDEPAELHVCLVCCSLITGGVTR